MSLALLLALKVHLLLSSLRNIKALDTVTEEKTLASYSGPALKMETGSPYHNVSEYLLSCVV
jgi:hypothetical protein